MSKTIETTNGEKIIVDDEDFDGLMQKSWHVGGGGLYALHTEYVNPKKNRELLMHRLILGAKKGEVVDHINHNGLDNRRENLRITTQRFNTANQRGWKKRKGSETKHKGVFYRHDDGSRERTRKYQAMIMHMGKCISGGYYLTENEAAIAYNNWALWLWGAHACLNKVAK